jgi:hypothetical protein
MTEDGTRTLEVTVVPAELILEEMKAFKGGYLRADASDIRSAFSAVAQRRLLASAFADIPPDMPDYEVLFIGCFLAGCSWPEYPLPSTWPEQDTVVLVATHGAGKEITKVTSGSVLAETEKDLDDKGDLVADSLAKVRILDSPPFGPDD